MLQYAFKTLVSAVILVAASEVSKRSTLMGALLVSLPLVSLMAMTWFYIDTKDLPAVASLSRDIFWLVLPSLLFFVVFPMMVGKGFGFAASMVGGIVSMLVAYAASVWLLARV